MATTHRSTSLGNKELMALYRGENKHYSQDCEDPFPESSDEGKGRAGVRSSVSLEIYGLQREHRERQVYFSNQEYYQRLEELKGAHLRNIAELERMYISQAIERYNREGDGMTRNAQNRRLFSDGPVRRLQRINSQEELDFHDSSSGSEQSEVCGEERAAEVEADKTQRNTGSLGRLLLVQDELKKQKQFRFQSRNPKNKLSGLTGIKVKAKSKVTIPKPFQMMLREEERKRHKVRTRSEVELENTLLRQELEELRECKKQFRASPAPSHIHVPLYEVMSQRFSQRPTAPGTCNQTINNNMQISGSQKPFQFLERERRKREARIVAELGNLCPKEETHSFKARPMPRSVYGQRYREDSQAAGRQSQFVSMEREVTEGHSDPNSDLESEGGKSETTTSEENKSSKCASTKPVKKQIKVSIEMVKDKPWSYIDTLKTTSCNLCSPLQPITEKSEYISV